jgi:hypothetical protein
MVITTNRVYKHWSQIFNNDSTLTSAILDRVLHHADTVIIEGKSFRMKDEIDGQDPMMPERAVRLPEYAVTDEAAAYIADALMDLAQIRRHHQSIAHDQQLRRDACLIATNKHLRDDDPAQLDLFGRHPPF